MSDKHPPLASGLTGDEAVEKLVVLGYGEEEANYAVARAIAQVVWPLRNHYVRHHREPDRFDIGTIVLVHPADLPVRDPLASMNGHQLSDAQIARHGTDRYPSPAAQYAKVLDEAGELGEAMMDWFSGEDPVQFARVRAEYADVGLALYALGRKLGLDLIACMRELVAGDVRDFRLGQGHELEKGGI